MRAIWVRAALLMALITGCVIAADGLARRDWARALVIAAACDLVIASVIARKSRGWSR